MRGWNGGWQMGVGYKEIMMIISRMYIYDAGGSLLSSSVSVRCGVKNTIKCFTRTHVANFVCACALYLMRNGGHPFR